MINHVNSPLFVADGQQLMMSPHESGSANNYERQMKGVALTILVMGLSLATIFLLYEWFGHVGPRFSTTQMEHQQDELRKMYGLPPRPIVPPDQLEVPPSLRNLTSTGT